MYAHLHLYVRPIFSSSNFVAVIVASTHDLTGHIHDKHYSSLLSYIRSIRLSLESTNCTVLIITDFDVSSFT